MSTIRFVRDPFFSFETVKGNGEKCKEKYGSFSEDVVLKKIVALIIVIRHRKLMMENGTSQN